MPGFAEMGAMKAAYGECCGEAGRMTGGGAGGAAVTGVCRAGRSEVADLVDVGRGLAVLVEEAVETVGEVLQTHGGVLVRLG